MTGTKTETTSEPEAGTYRGAVLSQVPKNDYALKLMAHIFTDYLQATDGVVVDVGCGRGDQMEALAALGYEVIGIDREAGPNVTHVCDFAEAPLPLEDNLVDFVFSKSVIEHLYLPQISHYMSEIKRILKPDGYVIIFTPDWIYCWDDFYDGFTHVTPFTSTSLEVCLKMNGFEQVETDIIIQLPSTWHSKVMRFLADVTRVLPLSKKWGKWIRWSKERQAIGIGRKSSEN